MSSMSLAFRSNELRPLSSLVPGTRAVVTRVIPDVAGHAERLQALGVTPGATVEVLQTFPGVVFQCDQTELAVERAVAQIVLVAVRYSSDE